MLTIYDNPDIGEYPLVWLADNGIITIDYGEFMEITEDLVNTSFNRHTEIDKVKRPILIHAPNIRAISSEVKPIIEDQKLLPLVSAVAIIVRSRVIEFIETIYMPLLNPPYPQKLFVSETKAVEWLKQYL